MGELRVGVGWIHSLPICASFAKVQKQNNAALNLLKKMRKTAIGFLISRRKYSEFEFNVEILHTKYDRWNYYQPCNCTKWCKLSKLFCTIVELEQWRKSAKLYTIWCNCKVGSNSTCQILCVPFFNKFSYFQDQVRLAQLTCTRVI